MIGGRIIHVIGEQVAEEAAGNLAENSLAEYA